MNYETQPPYDGPHSTIDFDGRCIDCEFHYEEQPPDEDEEYCICLYLGDDHPILIPDCTRMGCPYFENIRED